MSSLKDFLNHKTRESEKSNYLRWRKEGVIKVVLHTRSNITALWQHPLPRIQVLNKDSNQSREVWGGSWNCIEPEVILRRQYFRDRETGERNAPPTVCPMCILSETLREAVKLGELSLTEPVFKWVGDDLKKARIITAGGFYNAYGSKHLTGQEKALMKKAGIKQSEGWKENAIAKCNYLFVVVDADKPEDGIQLAIENTMLGQKMQEAIIKRMERMGEEDGDPLQNPVVFKWKYNANENEIGKKYSVTELGEEISDEVMELIQSDPPDLDHIISRGNVKKLRKELEARALVDLPWDDIFGPAEKALGINNEEEDEEEDEEVEIPDLDDEEEEAEEEEAEEEEAVMYDCDVCGASEVMAEDDTTCPECGATYNEEGEVLTHPGYDFNEEEESYTKKVVKKKKAAKKKAKKTTSKKVAAKKTTSKKVAAKKTTSKKVAAKKTTSKKKVSAKKKKEPEDLDAIFGDDDIAFEDDD